MYRKHRQECHYDPRRCTLPLPRAHTRTCPRVGQRARRLPRDGYPLCDLLSLAVTGKALRSRGTSTFSCASAGSWICAARTSHQCSPGGGRRLPVGAGGIPAESLARPVVRSRRTMSPVTSRFSSPSRSWRGLEFRRRVPFRLSHRIGGNETF